MQPVLLTGALAALLASVASIAAAQTGNISAQEYVAMASSSDMFEIESSKMALQHARSAEVRKFAEEMIRDHATTTSGLMAAARQEHIGVPSSPMPKQAQMLAKLKGTSDGSFDATYLDLQRMSHEEAVALHTAYARNGDDAALRATANKAVPIVEEHYREVRGLRGA
jgi:putative membrane protein